MNENPVTFIRESVFGCATQDQFAGLLGTTQASISRWEAAGRIPGLKQELIRDKARERGIAWDDRYFFSSPPTSPSDESEQVEAGS